MPGSGMTAFYLPLSLFFFVGGGLIYLLNVNRFVFAAVAWLVVLGLMDYTQLTVKPIFKPNTLYYGPFFSLGVPSLSQSAPYMLRSRFAPT